MCRVSYFIYAHKHKLSSYVQDCVRSKLPSLELDEGNDFVGSMQYKGRMLFFSIFV